MTSTFIRVISILSPNYLPIITHICASHMIVSQNRDDGDRRHIADLDSNYDSDCGSDPGLCLSPDFCFYSYSDIFDPRYGVPLREKIGKKDICSARIRSYRNVSLKRTIVCYLLINAVERTLDNINKLFRTYDWLVCLNCRIMFVCV